MNFVVNKNNVKRCGEGIPYQDSKGDDHMRAGLQWGQVDFQEFF